MGPRLYKRHHVEQGLEVLAGQSELVRARVEQLTEAHLESLCGKPTLTSFTSLIKSICSQQLSTKAARTIYGRVLDLVPAANGVDVCPNAVAGCSEVDLRSAGLSTAKLRSVKDLAARFVDGQLSDELLSSVEDVDRLGELLLDVKGIGPWTVQMFAIFFLRLPDVEVLNDLGVRKGCAKLYNLKQVPSKEAMEAYCKQWKPYRSLGAHLCWKILDM